MYIMGKKKFFYNQNSYSLSFIEIGNESSLRAIAEVLEWKDLSGTVLHPSTPFTANSHLRCWQILHCYCLSLIKGLHFLSERLWCKDLLQAKYCVEKPATCILCRHIIVCVSVHICKNAQHCWIKEKTF